MMDTPMQAHFFGGPLDGEIRTMPSDKMELRFPALRDGYLRTEHVYRAHGRFDDPLRAAFHYQREEVIGELGVGV